MANGKPVWTAVAIGVALLSFWAGSAYRDFTYSDICLDLGGGREPGGHETCVVAPENAPLRLGPILIAPESVVSADVEIVSEGKALLNLSLKKDIAAALSAYTKNAIGQSLDIVVGGQLVNSVTVREGIAGTQVTLALTDNIAEKALVDLKAGRQ